jgi:N-dimethylarginine dimethylaminohydrolase
MLNPKRDYGGKIEDYPLTEYPDYESGKPPRTEVLQEIGYLDEYERVWGKSWGAQGIGKLREVALTMPTQHEVNPLWSKDPSFFLLRRVDIHLGVLQRAFEEYAKILEAEDVKVHWMEIRERMGAYGPMRKLFMNAFPFIAKGGAIIPRVGHASFIRGIEVNFMRFLIGIDCPILHMVHGKGICEVGVFMPVAEDVILGFRSCASNDDGIEQVLSVLYRSGVKEVHIADQSTIFETFGSGGEFHIDMVVGVVDHRVAIIYPAQLDYKTFMWLKEKRFHLIEIPPDEQMKYYPAKLLILEPGKVIMPAGARKTIKKVREAGIEVIEFDTEGLMVGTNGLRCVTMCLVRDPGPGLDE